MYTFHTSKKQISIPTTWEELTPTQLIYTMLILRQVASNSLSVASAKLNLLKNYTNYTHNNEIKAQRPPLSYYLRLCYNIIRIGLCIPVGAKKELINYWIHNNKPIYPTPSEMRDNIAYNLRYLSERITFPFIQTNNKLQLNSNFTQSPIPCVRVGFWSKHTSATFNISTITTSNLTAAQFADALDIARAYAHSQDKALLDTLTAILYTSSYCASTLSVAEFARVSPIIKYTIYFWFTGIVTYLTQHPIYSILFAGKPIDTHKINLGMTESIMQLSITGFGSMPEMNAQPVLQFFDLQVKALKKTTAESLAKGVTVEQISAATNLTLSQINSLC